MAGGMLGLVDHQLQRALAAIDEAEWEVAAAPPAEISEQYARDIAAVMALPHNREGADKSHVWAAWAACRMHFARAQPS